MSKQITITLPDGYEDATHVVVVATGETQRDYPVYATIIPTKHPEADFEIGGGAHGQVMADVARVLKTAMKPFRDALPR